MKLKITETFKFAHAGVRVVEYNKGDEVETDDEELVEIATREGWAKRTKEGSESKRPDENKSLDQAPENK